MTTSKEEPRILRLSREDDGREVWLDTATGQQLLGVSSERIRRMLHAVVPVCEQYCRGLMAVVFAGTEPAVAIEAAES